MKRYAAVLSILAPVLALIMAGAGPAHAAPPDGVCHDPDPGRPTVRERPWAQQVLDPRLVWPHSRGAGVTVAVVDSGVDADHPQLRRGGKVLAGKDFFESANLPGNFDCVSHGTGVAGIIAADPVAGIGFHGVAPDARILPVRISAQDIAVNGESLRIDLDVLARGIRYAVDAGARVINLSIAGYADFPAIRSAVGYAVSRDVLVVAAVGNGQQDGAGELPSFPAAYDGVLGVGAIDIDGARTSSSQVGPYVDLVAPGDGVLTTTRVAGHAYATGTSYAAPFVSATAALVRAARPELSAPEVARRLIATASPARGGTGSHTYGAGLVNPYRAVTDGMDLAEPAALPAHTPAVPDRAALAEAAWHERAGTVATWSTVVILGVIVLAVVAAVVVPRGRRRRWRPAMAAPLPTRPTVIEPPEQMFLVDQ
ncbi:type VII secretion-associated serine protease mycosin [Actinophytocola sediminis]